MPDTRSSLLSRVRDFDDDAGWKEFDRLYRPMLARYAQRRGLGPDAAEEIAQQCLEVVVSQIRAFRRRRSFRGWLRRIVDNKVKQHLASRRAGELGGDALVRAVGSVPDAGELWERQWNRTHLLYCLASLRNEFAAHTLAAFELYVLEERPVRDIAERLSLTPNQIYVAKSRVMKRLSTRFSDLVETLYGVSR
ncbi:MAG: RNA polymerase sigma factor [Phycisphaerae bacterium]